MDRRLALTISLVAAGLAVAIVAVDLQYNVTVSLQARDDGQWATIVRQEGDGFDGPRHAPLIGCASQEMRIVIDNGIPWRQTLDVEVYVFAHQAGREERILTDTVAVAGGERAIIPFSVPDWAVADAADPPDGTKATASVDVRVGDTWLGTCVEADA